MITSKVDSTSYTMKGEWSDLPHDLLSLIAKVLELIDFLSFRCVCKDWHVASSKVSVEDKTVRDPWFLTYDEGECFPCSLLRRDGKFYTINIPELDRARCLASYGGWLLIFREGSLFFFCPFSRAKINLPNCPFTQVTEHVAAFTSSPTSQDCIVVVVNRSNILELELFMLFRGENVWSKHCFEEEHCFRGYQFDSIRAAFYYQGEEFHFLDIGGHYLVTFNVYEAKHWKKYKLSASHGDELSYTICRNAFKLRYNEIVTELLEKNVSISTCGTITPPISGEYDIIIQNECIKSASTQPESRHIKGVWIRPCYFYVPPDQSW